MKTETVWISRAMSDPTLIKSITSNWMEFDPDKTVDAIRRSKMGEPLPSERFPTEMHCRYKDKRLKKLPDIYSAGGFLAVSSACAEVLRQHDLGQTSLYPFSVFQFDQKTQVEGDYFHLNIGETKNAFEPDESPRARPFPTNMWVLPGGVSDGDIAVNSAALSGADLWIDPKMRNAFFLSDRLVQALKDAKLTRRFGLRKCRLV